MRVEGREVELTDQEFRLLHLLATHVGIVFSREALLSKIWRGDTFVTVRSVDTLVKRLRRRIEADPANPQLSADRLGRRLQVRGFRGLSPDLNSAPIRPFSETRSRISICFLATGSLTRTCL